MQGAGILAMMVLAATAAAGQQEWGVGTGPNLVKNPGLEAGGDGRIEFWSAPAGVYGPDETLARTGRRSLKYVNADPNRYVLCRQALDLRPGGMYEVKAWVRTRRIAGADSGAAVCLEWQDAGGKWLGGYYPPGRKGDTAKWTEVGGVSMRVPPGAAGGHVLCYVRRGMTGTAWWDDVSVRRVRQRPMYSFLVSPRYRGWILDGGPKRAEVRLRFVWDDVPGGAAAHRLTARLTAHGKDKPLAQRTVDSLPKDTLRVRLPLGDLPTGRYRLGLELADKASGKAIYQLAHRLERRTGPMPACFIDEHNRLIVDGKPFFPLGMYWSGITAEELRIYAESDFNCLMPYGRPTREQMDAAHKLGLKVIYSIKDFYHGTRWCPDFIRSPAEERRAVGERVRAFRGHPALLAWYINDELPLAMLPRLQAHQQWVEHDDPNHPTWVVLYQVADVACYAGSFDAIGTDPYPIPNRPPAMAGQWARQTRQAVEDARAVWMVPQVFNWAAYRKGADRKKNRPPTFDEMRSMTWQCIAEGADGIVFYSWFNLRRDRIDPFEKRWPLVKRIAAEVRRMAPVLLSVEPVGKLKVDAPAAVHWTARRHGGSVYLFLVNDASEPAAAKVRLPARPRRVTLEGKAVRVGEAGTIDASLLGLGVAIYRIDM